MKPHFQCAEQVKPPSNLTKYCACHESLKLKISSETPWSASANRKTIRGYPRIIRRYPRIKSSSRTRRFGDLPDPILVTLFYCKIQHFAVLLSPKMSRSAAPVTKSHPQVTRQPQQILRLPHKMNYEVWLYEVLLDWTVTWLTICYFTNLSLYESITLRIYYFTNLLLYESITLRIYYFTNLLLYESITLRIYYFTDLLLYESITLRIDYFTNRLLYESITLRIYYFTNLLLYESITLRIYYFTNLLLYESITLRIYYFANLLLWAFLKVRNSEVSHPNFLW